MSDDDDDDDDEDEYDDDEHDDDEWWVMMSDDDDDDDDDGDDGDDDDDDDEDEDEDEADGGGSISFAHITNRITATWMDYIITLRNTPRNIVLPSATVRFVLTRRFWSAAQLLVSWSAKELLNERQSKPFDWLSWGKIEL